MLSTQWQTTWDRTGLFSDISPSTPIDFVTPGAAGDADIQVADGTTYQSVVGFGGTLGTFSETGHGENVLIILFFYAADSSALLLNNLKV